VGSKGEGEEREQMALVQLVAARKLEWPSPLQERRRLHGDLKKEGEEEPETPSVQLPATTTDLRK